MVNCFITILYEKTVEDIAIIGKHVAVKVMLLGSLVDAKKVIDAYSLLWTVKIVSGIWGKIVFDGAITLDAKVDSVLNNKEWIWKPAISEDLARIQSNLVSFFIRKI
uniref:Uncharacterized protein n=1 Tax=Fagus sylvatica TaxID=28930 RepID=A0A2N9GBM7_FAGSY